MDRRLDKWGSQEFAAESPFWPAAASSDVRQAVHPGWLRAAGWLRIEAGTCGQEGAACGTCGSQAYTSSLLTCSMLAGRAAAAPGWRQVGAADAHHCGSGDQL